MQYLYDEGDSLAFMDTESYDQESIDKKYVSNILDYIKEGDMVDIALYEGRPISIEPPTFVVLQVVYAEPGVRGDTSGNVTKQATLETGGTVAVPLFINVGDMLKIDTRSHEYVERINKK